MKIILTHEQADFDAAGSVLAAWLLDRSRIPVLPKRRNRNLAAFLEDHKTAFPFVTLQNLPKGKVSRIFLTDTQNIIPHKQTENVTDVIVWDHHPQRHILPDRDENIYDLTGACTTFLVEKIIERPDIKLEKIHATLLLMGIYEDTGFLSFGTTTSRDIRAAAWLVDRGADLDLMRRYVLTPLTEHQQQACDLLMRSCRSREISGQRILTAKADVREISDEFSAVAHHMRDLLSPDGLILILGTKSGVRLICRGTTDEIDFGSMMRTLGGGGHTRAASALIPVTDPEHADMDDEMDKTEQILLRVIPDHIQPLKINLWEKLCSSVSDEQMMLIGQAVEAAEKLGMPIYIVGGVVRDLLLDRPMMDFDIVAEGDATLLGKQLAETYGGSLTVHKQFCTAKWETPNGYLLDLISARSEYYPVPASLPEVKPGSIHEDLKRRDFTINTLALRLDGEGRGEITDCCCGRADLREKLIRTLHDRSFIDDPTRMFRAVRFEQRFGFHLEPETLRQMRKHLEWASELTGQRIWHELMLFCAEPSPEKDFERIVELGIAQQIHSRMEWNEGIASDFKRFRETSAEPYWQEIHKKELEWAESEGFLWIWLSGQEMYLVPEIMDRLLVSGRTKMAVTYLAVLRSELHRFVGKKPSEMFEILELIPLCSLYLYTRFCVSGAEKDLIRAYVTEMRMVHSKMTGYDLMRLGVKPGPMMSKLLWGLRAGCLDGTLRTKDEEKNWVLQEMKKEPEANG